MDPIFDMDHIFDDLTPTLSTDLRARSVQIAPDTVTVVFMVAGEDGFKYLETTRRAADVARFLNMYGNDCAASILLPPGVTLAEAATTRVKPHQLPVYAALTLLEEGPAMGETVRTEAHESWFDDEGEQRVVIVRFKACWAFLREGVVVTTDVVVFTDLIPWLEVIHDGQPDPRLLHAEALEESMRVVVIGCLDLRLNTYIRGPGCYGVYGAGTYYTPYKAYDEGAPMIRQERVAGDFDSGRPGPDGLPGPIPLGI